MSVSSNLRTQPFWLDTFPDADVLFGFDSTGMWFSGNASLAPYPVRTNYDIDGETTVVIIYTFVHADVDDGCPDQGICFFKADVEPYWSWGDNTSRIAVQYNCGDPEINGQEENNVNSQYELTTGDTYTARVTYNPVAETITHELFDGASATGSPVDTLTLTNERLSAGAYRIGFHADLDTDVVGGEKSYFTYLQISEGPVETGTRVFRALHFPHRRREIVSAENPTPINVQPGEMLYDEEENKLYAGLADTSAVEVSSGGGGSGGNPFDQDLNTHDNVTFNNVTLTSSVVVSGITNAGEGYISPVPAWGGPGGTQWSDMNGTYVRTAVAVRPTGWANDGMHTPEPGTHNYYLVQNDALLNGVAFFLAPGNRTGWGTDPDDDGATDPPVNYWRLCSGADWPRTYFTNPSSNPYVFPTTGWVPVSASAPNGNEGSGSNGADFLPNYGGGFAVVAGGGTAQISGIGMMLPNFTQLVMGSFGNDTGGANGISLICAVGYEFNWQGGRLRSWRGNITYPIYCDSPFHVSDGADTTAISGGGVTFTDETFQRSAGITSVVDGVNGATRITNCMAISQTDYDAIASKDPNTLYVIT